MRTIFYSWQSMTDQKVNRFLIRDSLHDASKELRSRVDDATRGVGGSPEITDTILRKIKRSAAFVADLTLLPLQEETERYTSNPNVLIEYGYALATIGAERIIPVLNKHYGAIEKLPFDLKHRAVRVSYELSPTAPVEQRKAVKKSLIARLSSELRLILENPLSVLDMSDEEVEVARFILTSDQLGSGKEFFTAEQVAAETELAVEDSENALRGLKSRHYLRRTGKSAHFQPTHLLYVYLDRFFYEWDTQEDAKEICLDLLAEDAPLFDVARFARRKGWTLRRVNPALLYLKKAGIIEGRSTHDTDLVVPYASNPNDAVRGFLRGDYRPLERLRG